MFSGSIPALVTPFRDGAFDEDAFRRFVDWQIEQGSSGLVPVGTTGEAPTLTNEEHHRVIRFCVEQADGRVPVIAGCGSNNTDTALWHMQEARAVGADAALLVAPYYNRPTQAGLIAHYSFLAENSSLPMILYNVPGRTVTDILPETVVELANRYPERIVGIKDASGDLDRVKAHAAETQGDFCQLSGNDESALHFNQLGGVGCISVSANVAPKLCAEFQAASLSGDIERAEELDRLLGPLHAAMFADASPGPAKYALSRLHDWMNDSVRLPILPANDEARRAVDAAMERAGLL